MVSNRFLEMNGVPPAPPVAPKPKPQTNTRFLEINGVYNPPAPPAPPAPPKTNPTTSTRFLEINGVAPALQSLANGVGRTGQTSGPSAYNYGQNLGGPAHPATQRPPIEMQPRAPQVTPPTPEAIMRAESRLAAEILAGRDADKLHLVNPATGREYTDDEIAEVSQRIEIQKADQRVAREINAGRDADRLHLINPRTGAEYTDKEIQEISGDLDAQEQRNADIRVAREIAAGRDADKLHLINPATGREYTDAEIGEIAGLVDDHNTQVQDAADARVAREILAGRDADRMHFINPETGREYTDAEINEIAGRLDAHEQAQADARVAREIWEGRDADRMHFINPATGQEYTDVEIGDITDQVRSQQRDQITPQFEAEVDRMVADGTPQAVAEQLVALSFVQSGIPEAALPTGVAAFDPSTVFVDEHEQFDTARDVARGDNGRVDQFVSLEDLDATVDNPDDFDPEVVATAMLIRGAVDQDGNGELRAQFEKKGWLETIRDSTWLDPNSDSIVVNLVRGSAGIPPSPAFLNRLREDGPGELLEIGESVNELNRFLNPAQNIIATGFEIATSDDPLAALQAAPGEMLADYKSFGLGVLDWGIGTAELGVAAWALSNPANAVFLERTTGVNVYDEVGYAAEGLARGFLTDPDQLAAGIVGYDMFIDDPIRWAGQQAPDIVLEIITGGLGAAGKVDDILGAASDLRRVDLPPPGRGDLIDGALPLDGDLPPVGPTRDALARDFFGDDMVDALSNPGTPLDLNPVLPVYPDMPVNPSLRKGELLEFQIDNEFRMADYDTFVLTNGSGHGADLIAVRRGDPTDVFVVEVKANTSSLSNLQRLGGEAYLENVLNRAGNNPYSWNVAEFDDFLSRNGLDATQLQRNADYLIARQKNIEPDMAVGEAAVADVAEWTPGTTNTLPQGGRRDWNGLNEILYGNN